MKLAELAPSTLRHQLAHGGVWLRTGPFSVRIRSRVSKVAEGLADLYGEFETDDPAGRFTDFHVAVDPSSAVRRWLRPQVDFSFDGQRPFKPLPYDQAYPMLEWGLNWCVSAHAHQYLIVHAAVAEKNGAAAILPAPPGSGKSTLTAGLVLSGWRLLSDELALIDRESGFVHPLPRPVSLKNASIPLIRSFSAEAFINRPSYDTAKGTVAHMRPPAESVRRQHEPAPPRWVIFPQWSAGADTRLTPRSAAQTFMFLAQNAFNYSQLGADGFRVGTRLVEQTASYDFAYRSLDDAIRVFDGLADSQPQARGRPCAHPTC